MGSSPAPCRSCSTAAITSWSEQAFLTASNSRPNNLFGAALAVAGDTLAVRSPGESSDATGIDGDQNDTSAPNAGAAYVFERSGTSWSQKTYVKSSSTQANDQFGNAVALSTDTLVIGAGNESNAEGGVHVFRRTNGTSPRRTRSPVRSTRVSGSRSRSPATRSPSVRPTRRARRSA